LFFIRFLTDAGDLVLDPFAGSNTTGKVCEDEGRNWIAIECDKHYLETSGFRFEPRDASAAEPATNGECEPIQKKGGRPKKGSTNGGVQRTMFD
jgi:DNA modification methylase